MNKNSLYEDELGSTKWMGEIVDVNDETYTGRCRVRVWGKFDELPIEDIPWARPYIGASQSTKSNGFISVPRVGTHVRVRFIGDSPYNLEWESIDNPNKELIEKIKGSYEGAHALIYDIDENLKMYYTKEDGLKIMLKDSQLNIKSDNSILIEHKGTSSSIELKGGNITIQSDSNIECTSGSEITLNSPFVHVNGNKTEVGSQAVFSAVAAEPLWAFLKALGSAVDAKWPPSPGLNSGLAATAEQASSSKTVSVTL